MAFVSFPSFGNWSVVLIYVLAIITSPQPTAANFLSKDVLNSMNSSGDLLEQLAQVLSEPQQTHVAKRVERLEEAMRPTFLSLPRSPKGLLPPAGVRFLLHRLFVSRHGWFVRGLTNEGKAWSSTSPAELFVEHAGDETSNIFEDRLSTVGMSLHDVAVMGALLESLVHSETIERLQAAYALNNISISAKEHDTELIIETYMTMYLRKLDYNTATVTQIQDGRQYLERYYPGWNETQKWMHEVRKEVLRDFPQERHSFETTTRVLEEISERYGRFQDKDCIEMKARLMEYEHLGTGRVPLQAFYQAFFDGHGGFSESKLYLQNFGALDESDPERPSVIIPNYINSPTNCVAGSKYYLVCCINECEDLFTQLESRFAAPDATPQQIVDIVQQLPSATVDVPRNLSTHLIQRLDDIAAYHDGKVPLHGRLFNQWMHNAYPRECPFPHLTGSVNHLAKEDWLNATGRTSVAASRSEMNQHIEQCSAAGVSENEVLAWSHHEELYVHDPLHSVRPSFEFREVVRAVVFMLAGCSMSYVVAKHIGVAPAKVSLKSFKKEEKWMV